MRLTCCVNCVLCIAACVVLQGCPSPYELGFPGGHPVRDFQVEFAPGVPISVFYPDAAHRYPVVIINTGWNQPRGSYEGYATQLAQWGYIAIIRSYPNLSLIRMEEEDFLIHVRQNSAILDWCAIENERPESPLFGKVDTAKAGVTGHSLGAGIAMRTALLDPRVVASVSLDSTFLTKALEPYTAMFASTGSAMMYLRAERGGWCSRPPMSGGPLFDISNAPAAEIAILGADHMDFEDSLIGFDYLGQVACSQGPADPQEVRNIATRYMIAWFNVNVKGMDDFETYYAGTKAETDVENGLVEIRTKLE